MTGEQFAAALPLPLILAGIAFTFLSAGLRAVRDSEGWADLTLAIAVGSLVLALAIAWCTA